MFRRVVVAIGPRGPESPEGFVIHVDPEKGPPRYDLRKVRVPADDPDLGERARERNREENPGFELPGSVSPRQSRRETYSFPRIKLKPD